jgi:hypothetical protein
MGRRIGRRLALGPRLIAAFDSAEQGGPRWVLFELLSAGPLIRANTS